MLTVLLSFVLYPKPFSTKYILGGIAVVISLLATHELQRRKGGDVQQSPAPKIAPVKKIKTKEKCLWTNRKENQKYWKHQGHQSLTPLQGLRPPCKHVMMPPLLVDSLLFRMVR